MMRGVRSSCTTLFFALLVLAPVCGCAAHGSQLPPSPNTPAPSDSAAAPVGSVTVRASGAVLYVTRAVLDAATGQLSMTVRNDSSIPDHLDLVATTVGQTARLRGGSGADGPLESAGILLGPHTTTVFGGRGPRVLLSGTQAAPAGNVATYLLEFGVGGMVRLQAPIAD